MDSENSYSGESSSSSETSSGSSDADEEIMEPIRILGHSMELPQELCEDYSVFREFFSIKTWEALEEKHREQLTNLLPKFTENQSEEQEKTIKMLFEHEPFHFSSPLTEFYNNLRHGNYRPDIAKMRKFLIKARAKQHKHKIKSYYAKLLPEVLISRERLLAAAKGAPPGPAPCLPPLPPKRSSKNNYKPLYLRAKQRYFEELAAIQSEVGGDESEDENYPDGPPEQFSNKKKPVQSLENSENNISGTLSGPNQPVQTSLQCLKNILIAHRARRQYRENHPELNVSGITLEDIKQRVSLVNGSKKFMFGNQKLGVPIQKLKRNTKKDAIFKHAKPYNKTLKKAKGDHCGDSIEDKLLPNIKIKCEQDETDSESSSFVDPVMSPNQSNKKVMDYDIMTQDSSEVKHNISRTNYSDSKMDISTKRDTSDVASQNISRIVQHVPIKLEDLDGIDMMALPVELADDSGEVIQVDTSTETVDESVVDPDESLTETTHANFLSLVRALFPARVAHRATKQQLHARCAAVMKSPIAPLNTWYNLSDDWCSELDSALDFLAGERGTHPEDFVPYLQYIPETQTYQWIGAGRDCDAILGRICERWLRAVSPAQPTSEAPPPRYPTTWAMRAPTGTEITEFRTQERKRFSSAAKPFTYIQHGYRSVVGPCGRAWGGWGGGTGSALVAAGRPRHATFAALLRDALARLPNGRGTRHDVLTLLKMSQWISPCSDQALLGAVSSALDKFHSAKRDPIVKYDQRTAIWTYLHRNRSEEDWVKLTSKGRGKAAIVAPLPSAPAVPMPSVQPPTTSSSHVSATNPASLSVSVRELPPLSPLHAVDLEVGTVEEVVDASDSDVDVDDTNASTSEPQLSFAQLLMQATQHTKQPQILPLNKAKGKLVATPAPKPKPTIITKQAAQSVKQGTSTKQATLMSQSVKQATLMAQSIKQATVVSQTKGAPMTVKTIPQHSNSIVPQTLKATSSPKQTTLVPPLTKQIMVQTKPGNMSKAPKQSNLSQSAKSVVSQSLMSLNISSQMNTPNAAQLSKSLPSLVAAPQKSPLIKQRPLQRVESSHVSISVTGQTSQTTAVLQQPSVTAVTTVSSQNPGKVPQGTRSLLIRPPTVETTVTAANIPTTQTAVSRRGVVRVLSPATPSSGKSLISPRALLQSGTATTKKRTTGTATPSVVTIAQSTASMTTLVSSVPTMVTSSVSTRTVQLAGGRTVQLAANQTVHLPGGQAVQLTPGHTLQLSSLQLPTHSVRLPSGQTVQLASSQAIQAVKMSTANVKNLSPRGQQSSPTVKNATSQSTVQIPVSTVQLSGQTVQIGGQTVQLAGQSVQLTGHTVKLPSGQSVQVASQSMIPSQSVQLPSGQTVQLSSGNVQTVQLSGSNLPGQSMQIASGQSVQLGSQTVQLSGQTVQLAGGQTVQLPSGQTLQLSSGQTVQLSSGQTLQLASGQTVHLANQSKTITQVVRSQNAVEKPVSTQPIVAKLLTNAQGQMISLEGMVGASRSVQAVTSVGGVGGGVVPRAGLRVVSPGTRLARPLLLTSAKPLHNIILQQSDGSAIRVTSSGGSTSSQTLVLSNIGSQTTTATSSSAPILKLHQVNQLQQVKLAQGIKIQQSGTGTTAPTTSGVRNVLMDGQQLKLVGGRHVLARILRPAHPPP